MTTHSSAHDGLLAVTGRVDVSDHPARRGFADFQSQAIADGVLELFERARAAARAEHVDLIVLSARRLACLYELALRNGMEPIRDCLVVSDRFLDLIEPARSDSADSCDETRPRGWRWKRVLILDDSVVLGTTLHNLVRDVWRLVGKDGYVWAASACRDIEQTADFLLEHCSFGSVLETSTEELKTFSRDVVTELFRQQVPFFSDFPVTVPVRLDVEDWNSYLEAGLWSIADVTAPLVGDENHWALTQVPRDEYADAVRSRLPEEVADLVENFKLRSFVARVPASDVVSIRFVPIAMLGACDPADLDSAIRQICRTIDGEHLERTLTCLSPVAKHRLVQMYASAAVLCIFILDGDRGTGQPADRETAAALQQALLSRHGLDRTSASLYAGPFLETVSQFFDRLVDWLTERPEQESVGAPAWRPRPTPSRLLTDEDAGDFRETLWAERELLASQGVPTEPDNGTMIKLGLIFGASLSYVFGYLSRTKEAQQRERIRRLQSERDYDDSSLSGDGRVLNQGLTMTELTQELYPELLSGPPWHRSLMSLGVDVGNDLGVIVPSTKYDEERDLVYRCYRLGETAPLAEWPLPIAAFNQALGRGNWDEISRSVGQGYPIRFKKVPLSEQSFRMPFERDDWDKTLERRVRAAVPSPHIADRFEGYVVATTADDFSVQMKNSRTGATATATIAMAWLPSNEQGSVRVGSEFVWIVYDDDGPSPEPGAAGPHFRFLRRASINYSELNRISVATAARLAAERAQ